MTASEDFRSIYRHGFARVAACTTRCTLADPAANAAAIMDVARACHERGAALAVFPELGVSGYAISDLLHQSTLLDAVEQAVADLVAASADLLPLLLVGAPLRHAGALYNCALAIHRGRLLGVVPKVHLPNYREFYEPRHFVVGDGMVGGEIAIGALTAPFGTDLLFAAEDVPGLIVHAEICEDIWIPVPPSSQAALAGATVLANLSASNITIGKAETRRLLCASQSARCVAAYLYAAAGAGESTTDLAWDGQASIFENGATLAETERFPSASQFACGRHRPRPAAPRAHADGQLRHQPPAPSRPRSAASRSGWIRRAGDIGLERKVERYPFVPADPARLEQDCYEAYNIQVSGLAQRLRATGIKRVVIGVSGGLDSTQALIVCAQSARPARAAARQHPCLHDARVSPPPRTPRATPIRLMQALGVTWQELDIRPAARAHAERHRPSVRAGRAGL